MASTQSMRTSGSSDWNMLHSASTAPASTIAGCSAGFVDKRSSDDEHFFFSAVSELTEIWTTFAAARVKYGEAGGGRPRDTGRWVYGMVVWLHVQPA